MIALVLLLLSGNDSLGVSAAERARLDQGEVIVSSSAAPDQLGKVATARD